MNRKLLLLVGLVSTAFAHAGVYTFTYRDYPKAGADCNLVALSLGEKWAKATGSKVVRSRCESVENERFVIAIRYEAEAPIRPVSTAALTSSSLYSRGIFKTKAQCEENLEAEAKHFEVATGLTPAITYCSYDPLEKKHPFGLRIDGFGVPRLEPKIQGSMITGQAMGYSEVTFLEAVQKRLSALGVDVRFVNFHPNFVYGDLTVFHYSDKIQRLSVNEVAKLRTKEDCFAALSEMERFLVGTKHEPLFSYCAYQHVAQQFEVVVLNWDKESLEFIQTQEAFDKFETCEAERLPLVDYYRNTLKRPVVGGLCSLPLVGSDHFMTSPKKWSITLFEENR